MMDRQYVSDMVNKIRAEGYAVMVFAPEEMPNTTCGEVERAMVEAGQDLIDFDNEHLAGRYAEVDA